MPRILWETFPLELIDESRQYDWAADVSATVGGAEISDGISYYLRASITFDVVFHSWIYVSFYILSQSTNSQNFIKNKG